MDRTLITGGYGCIGSEAAKWLLRNTNTTVVVASRSVSEERTERVFHDTPRERLLSAELDIGDPTSIRETLSRFEPARIIHMAALQTPDCNANRDRGLQVNLAGTQHLLECVKELKLELERFVFASSVAVYGPRSAYAPGTVPMLAPPAPVNVYGVWKLAGEQLCEFFASDTGIPTLSLRPGVLFGPGRDAGLTSTPTTAMKQVALGRPFEIPFSSRQDYQFAPDVGAAVGISATAPFTGYGVYTLPGRTYDSHQFAAAIERAASQLGLAGQCQIRVGNAEVPFICELDYVPFSAKFPGVPLTDLDTAVKQSLSVFRDQAARGWLTHSD